MSLIEQSDARHLLSPYEIHLRDCLFKAWNDYQCGIPGDFRASFKPRTRANIVHCRIAHHVTVFAESACKIRVVEQKQMFGLVVDERLLIRFKKLDEDKLSRNNMTQQVRNFKRHRQLDGLPPLSHLEIGYVLDLLETHIKDVHVVCPNGENNNYWAYAVSGEAIPNIIEMFPARGSQEQQLKRFSKAEEERIEHDAEDES